MKVQLRGLEGDMDKETQDKETQDKEDQDKEDLDHQEDKVECNNKIEDHLLDIQIIEDHPQVWVDLEGHKDKDQDHQGKEDHHQVIQCTVVHQEVLHKDRDQVAHQEEQIHCRNELAFTNNIFILNIIKIKQTFIY